MTEWYDSIVSSVKNALEAVYIKKSNTSGLVKNDGTIDTNSYLTTNQGAGNYGKFLKIDNNGNIICQSASFSGQDLTVTQISGTDNLNNYKTTGFYYITNNNSNNITNMPPSAELYDVVLMVEGKATGYVQQIASVNDNIYIRSYENTSDVWTNWINIRTPLAHADSTTTYGAGTNTNYGHIKLSDTYTSNAGAANTSIGASGQAVYDCYTALNNKKNNKYTLYYGNSSQSSPLFGIYDRDNALKIKQGTPLKAFVWINREDIYNSVGTGNTYYGENICDSADASDIYVKYDLGDTINTKFMDETDKCAKLTINWAVGTSANIRIYAYWNMVFLASDAMKITVVDNYS